MNVQRCFTALLFVVALFLLYLAWSYTAPISYDPLGPRPYPVLLLSLLALCCAFLFITSQQDASDCGHTPGLLKKLAACALALLAYALLFEWIGFPLATAVMAFVLGRLFGGSHAVCALSGILLGGGLYILFDYLLDVPLPLGILG